MGIEKFIFYIFSIVVIGSASMVVISRNAVHAVLFLVLAFIGTSGLWILLQAEFLALILVLVYVGAVMVLFLFVVMMLDIDIAKKREGFLRYMPFAALISVLLVLQIGWVIGPEHFGLKEVGELLPKPAEYSNSKEIGQTIFTEYLIAFELAAGLLLVAMVSAVGLTFRGVKNRRSQKIREQVQTSKKDRLTLIKELD